MPTITHATHARRALSIAIVVIAAMAPAAAHADTYCVTPSVCDHPQATLQAALTAAGTHIGADTLLLGAATYAQNSLSYTGPDLLEIDGAGRTASIISAGASPPASTPILNATGPITLRHLGITLTTSSGQVGLQAHEAAPATIDDVAVTASGSPTSPNGLSIFGAGTVTNTSIALPTGGDCIYSGGVSTYDHVTTTGCSASLNVQGGAATVRNSEFDGAGLGIDSGAGAAVTVDDTVLKPRVSAVALNVSSYASFQTTLTARHVTVVQPSGTALQADNNGGSASSAGLTVRDSIFRGATTSEKRSALGVGAASIAVDHTDLSGTAGADSGPGTTTNTAVLDVDPGFASGTDLHLTAASPLVDLDPAPLTAGEPSTDFDGTPRIVHGGRDLGAYELTRAPVVAPVTVAVTGPTTATVSGTIDPGGLATLAFLDYGLTAAYDTALALPNTAAGGSAVPQQLALTGLHPATTYHVRINATNANGTVGGTDVTFATPAAPPPPKGKAILPTLSKLKLMPAHRVTKHAFTLGFTISAAAGATFPATLKVAITHAVHGHRKGAKCLTTAHKGKACTVTRTVWSTSKRITKAGTGKLAIPAKPSGHALAPGRYTVKVTFAGKSTSLHLTIAKK